MIINGDVLLGSMAAALMTAWVVPDVFTNTETVALITLITISVYNTAVYLINRSAKVKAKRAALSITATRQDAAHRQDRVVDIRVKHKNRAITIPAYKIND